MATQRVRVEVEGLHELRARLAKAGNSAHLQVILAPAHREVGHLVDDDSRRFAHSAQMSRSVGSNRLTFPKTGPVIRVGGSAGDGRWAVGAQFGSNRYAQFPPSIKGGYTVVPAIEANVGRIEDRYVEAIDHGI